MSTMVAAPPVGRIVWRDLVTTDPERAKPFYTALFGWEIGETSTAGMSPYTMLHNAGAGFGGIVELDKEHMDVPSHWASYFLVENVDRAVEQTREAGGQIYVPGHDIPSVGRFAVVTDPQGATFQPFTLDNYEPDPPGMPPLGGVSWNELMTSDVEGAKQFYGDLVGWTPVDRDMGGMTYTIFMDGEEMIAGMMRKPDEMPVSMWVIYFHVAGIEQSLADVTRLGGQPVNEIIEVPGTGRVCWAMDPVGALFAMHESPK